MYTYHTSFCSPPQSTRIVRGGGMPWSALSVMEPSEHCASVSVVDVDVDVKIELK